MEERRQRGGTDEDMACMARGEANGDGGAVYLKRHGHGNGTGVLLGSLLVRRRRGTRVFTYGLLSQWQLIPREEERTIHVDVGQRPTERE